MKHHKPLARISAVALISALALSACGSDDKKDEKDPKSGGDSKSSGAQLYFVDGNTADYSKDFDPGTLEGVRATYPGAELGDEFKQRLLGIDKGLKDYTYGPESYDATIVTALAAIAAKSDDGRAIASKMQEVSAEGEKCTDFKSCSDLLADGKDIDYDGVSGPIDFNSTGSPSKATIGVFEYDDTNKYSPKNFETGEIPDVAEVKANQKIQGTPGKGDGKLVIGTLLPQTGDLAFLGPPEIAGVKLAIKEINEAGGVNGAQVTNVQADSGDGTPNIAPGEADKLIKQGADAVVGAASSSVSLSVIDRITKAGILQISPANTSTAFDEYGDGGLYFRTAPSDVLQGNVMGNTVIGDGNENTAILFRQDSYGEALANSVKKFYEDAGGKVVAFKAYDPNAASFSAEVNEIAAQDPDAVVLISFDETKKIVPELIKAGVGQKK